MLVATEHKVVILQQLLLTVWSSCCRQRSGIKWNIHPRCCSSSALDTAACRLPHLSREARIFSERERHVRYMLSPVRLSVVCRLSVYNVRAPYSGGSNFRQYFYGIRYLDHPLTSTENFTEIVPGNPSAGGVKHKRGSQV